MEIYTIAILLLIASSTLLMLFIYSFTSLKNSDIIGCNKCIGCKIYKLRKNNSLIGILLSLFGIFLGTFLLM